MALQDLLLVEQLAPPDGVSTCQVRGESRPPEYTAVRQQVRRAASAVHVTLPVRLSCRDDQAAVVVSRVPNVAPRCIQHQLCSAIGERWKPAAIVAVAVAAGYRCLWLFTAVPQAAIPNRARIHG
jgi:hypothetical protein